MIIEHFFYNGAIAVLIGMVYHRLVPTDPRPYAWIIFLSAPMADFFPMFLSALTKAGVPLSSLTAVLHAIGISGQGAITVWYVILISLILAFLRFQILPSALFAGIGYYAHLVEDIFAYSAIYQPFWSSFSQAFGLGTFRGYHATIFSIASPPVLIFGIILVTAAIGIRIALDGTGWIRHPLGSPPAAAAESEAD